MWFWPVVFFRICWMDRPTSLPLLQTAICATLKTQKSRFCCRLLLDAVTGMPACFPLNRRFSIHQPCEERQRDRKRKRYGDSNVVISPTGLSPERDCAGENVNYRSELSSERAPHINKPVTFKKIIKERKENTHSSLRVANPRPSFL
jgi:hypothetical protein